MISNRIQQIFAKVPEVKFGYADISYHPLSEEYQSALVLAVPYEPQLNIENYTEEAFDNSIHNARNKLKRILNDIKLVLKEEGIAYYIPPVAQQNEEELKAEFSFKYAAVNAGLGWIGKNDMLITEEYGPRVRLSAVLIDYPFEYGNKITGSQCGSCTKCVDICPHKALTGVNWDITTHRSVLIDYHLCNQKRSAYIKSHGRKSACGLCMVVCPYGMKNTAVYMELPLLKMTFHSLTKKDSTRTRLENSDYIQS